VSFQVMSLINVDRNLLCPSRSCVYHRENLKYELRNLNNCVGGGGWELVIQSGKKMIVGRCQYGQLLTCVSQNIVTYTVTVLSL
jgi:hypothetical protein